MSIFFHSPYKIKQLVTKCNAALWIFCGASVIGMGLFFLLDDKEGISIQNLNLGKEKKEAKDYSSIGNGALSLRFEQLTTSFSHLQKEIKVLGRLSRPGKTDSSNKILLGFKDSGQKMIASEGEKIYLSPTGIKENLCFSPVPTLLVMSLQEEKEGIRFFLEYDHSQKTQFFQKVEDTFPKDILDSDPFRLIREAKCWGPDRLIQEYGGTSYEKEKNQYQIEFLEDALSYVLYIGSGDYLMWDGHRWSKVDFSEISRRCPLAFVKGVSLSGVEMDVWDVSGFYCLHLKSPLQFSTKPQSKMEEVFSSLRLKTTSQVSGLLAKRRVILKKGDWWIKSKSGWHSIKSVAEIDAVLQHQTKGELFVFDAIENSQGKTVLKGHLFDEMRISMQPVSLQISEKQTSSKQQKPQGKMMPSQLPQIRQGEEKNAYMMEEDSWEKTP